MTLQAPETIALPPTLKQWISGGNLLKGVVLIRLNQSRCISRTKRIARVRRLIPEIYGKTFVFPDKPSAASFLLSLEGSVRDKILPGNSGSVITIRTFVRHLAEQNELGELPVIVSDRTLRRRSLKVTVE